MQITSLTIVYSTAYSGADQRKHQSSASLAFVRVIHRSPVKSPHKWPVTRKMFPFDDVIMDVHPNLVLYPNLAESCSSSSRIYISTVKSFWKFARSTAVILPCYVKNIWTNKQQVMIKRLFAIFELKMPFGRTHYIPFVPRLFKTHTV